MQPLTDEQINQIEKSAYIAALDRVRKEYPKEDRLTWEAIANAEAIIVDLAIKHAFPDQVKQIIRISYESVEELKREEYIHCVR